MILSGSTQADSAKPRSHHRPREAQGIPLTARIPGHTTSTKPSAIQSAELASPLETHAAARATTTIAARLRCAPTRGRVIGCEITCLRRRLRVRRRFRCSLRRRRRRGECREPVPIDRAYWASAAWTARQTASWAFFTAWWASTIRSSASIALLAVSVAWMTYISIS